MGVRIIICWIVNGFYRIVKYYRNSIDGYKWYLKCMLIYIKQKCNFGEIFYFDEILEF